MRINRPWRVAVAGAGAAALIAGLGGAAVASDGIIDLHDKVQPIHVNSGYDDTGGDDSAESADSPHSSPFDSTDSPAGASAGGKAVEGSPESADSPNASAVDSHNPPKKPTKAKPAADDSADSPALRRGGAADSGNSADSASSGGSADSAD